MRRVHRKISEVVANSRQYCGNFILPLYCFLLEVKRE